MYNHQEFRWLFRCQQSSAELESCSEKLHDVTEVAKKVKVSYPPEAPITPDWMKNKLDTVGQEMASIKARKTQVGQAIMGNRVSNWSDTEAMIILSIQFKTWNGFFNLKTLSLSLPFVIRILLLKLQTVC